MKYRIEYKHIDKDFEDVYNIEKESLNDHTIADMNQVKAWDNKNNDIHIFIRDIDVNKIVGEITLLPLSEEQFQKFMNNTLEDAHLNPTTLKVYKPYTSYYLLFSVIAIDKNYRNDRLVLYLLLKGLYEKIKVLKKRNTTFLNMCAEGQNEEGQKFVESFLNLKMKRITKDGYKLYCFDNKNEFDEWFKIFPTYINNYKEKFQLNIEESLLKYF